MGSYDRLLRDTTCVCWTLDPSGISIAEAWVDFTFLINLIATVEYVY